MAHDEPQVNCEPFDLSALQPLAKHEYDVQLKAFDDLDNKANWAIGYTSVSAAIIAWLTSNHVDEPSVVYFLGASLVSFGAAVVIVLIALWPKNMTGPPSASATLKRSRTVSPSELADEFVNATDNAIEEIRQRVAMKARLVLWSYLAIIGAFCSLLWGILTLSLG